MRRPEYTQFAYNESHSFIQRLKAWRGKIPTQTLNTLRGQALKGDLEGAEKGFRKLVREIQREA